MNRKKTILLIFLYAILQFHLFCQDPPGPVKQEVQPTGIESKIGYLSFAEETAVQPDIQKIFIAPQTRLPIMSDAGEYYLFLVKIDFYSVCCLVPKYQKYMVLMEPSKDGRFMYFRGGIEAEIVPFMIRAGEDMPITGSDGKSYFVSVKRLGTNVTVKIPKDMEGLASSKESSFAKFAAEQRKKGLGYYNGTWIPAAQAEVLRNSQLDRETAKQRRWDNLKSQAEAGILILKIGKVLHGSYKGADKVSILFESEGVTRQYGTDDVVDIDLKKALSIGNLDSADSLVSKAKDLAAGYPGEARRCTEQAQTCLRKVNPSISELMGKAMDLGAQITKINSGIDDDLKSRNLVLYNYEAFQKETLEYHLRNGHVLLGKKTWILPEQMCRRCSGSGEIACAKCQATGKVNKKCPKCQNGRITCHICEGSGNRTCNVCSGVGEFIRTCSYCGGSGVVSGYYSYPCGTNIFLSGGTFMVGTSSWYGYPYYTTKTCPACNGNGRISIVCTYCGGYGKMICPKTEKCDLCNGVGFSKAMCPDCEGRGRIICRDCKGKGFSGQAQKFPGEDEKPPLPTDTPLPAGAGKSQKMAP
ncbi:MAG TPA: hypothetical protein DET40_11125 [Lentisphaeria bacterium]|nr:MAG: hypothetical protein A2X45_20065 [Lentisphaerae bacterium GWF2_50_93]HCE44090.1 hypothetical protein [Lentisphaeria bacterium]